VEGGRIQFLQRGERRQYLEHYGTIDIALDPFPFCGHTTTCDGLWQGVPAVTLAGANYAGRMGVSVMSNLGMRECIAATPQEYVETAVRAAGDLNALAEVRATLRERMRSSVLTDGARFTRNLESAYRSLWRDWCAAGAASRSRSCM
jgi:predicted O-linked N-acetylglucosamine transferase (SPINDLY family)